jgi:glycosyltransferase involved in cell wall biosynthesis
VQVIPHGVDAWVAGAPTQPSTRPVVLTWGLLGPGKGIEWGIRALAELTSLVPRPIYRILGQTHPKVLLEHGEAYRTSLLALADRLGVGEDVEIDGRYQDVDDLAAQVAAADLVLLPYDSREQVTSGVLTEAVAAGKLVIATRFPHALELLSGGKGMLVEQCRPDEIAQAIRDAILDPLLAATAAARAQEAVRADSWSNVGERYRALSAQLVANEVRT